MKEIEVTCKLGKELSADEIQSAAIKALGVSPKAKMQVKYRIMRRSIDARNDILYRYRIEVYKPDEVMPEYVLEEYKDVSAAEPVIIIGAGPAGMFAALRLLMKGLKPVILERGKDVHQRKFDMAKLSKEGLVNPDSNYCFGEGGAGTFSDGKLYTRSSKRGDIREVLHQLVRFGADPSILIDAHPHIGSDKLPIVVENIRNCIIEHGGEYHFDSRVTDIVKKGDGSFDVIVSSGLPVAAGNDGKSGAGNDGKYGAGNDGKSGAGNDVASSFPTRSGIYSSRKVILATGHSARDIYEMFDRKGWELQAKGFALGVRVEHPQSLINSKSVLNEMNILTELFFVEAGATSIGDIAEISNIVKPNIGVITSVGPQHLNTFKAMNNVLKTKLELSDSLPPDGKLILNYQNEYLNGLTNKNIKETLAANSAFLHARNITHNDIYTEFDIYSYNKFLTHIKTKLLGEHFIDNIIICYAVKIALDDLYPLTNEEFKEGVLSLINPEHRLSTYEINKHNTIYRFIDDSYNSNTEGFIQAVKVLKHLTGLKVLITPGIVDSGKHSKIIADYLTPNLKELDDIVLVNNKEIKNLKQSLQNNRISYYIANSFNEALDYIYNKYSDFNMEVINILLENDLPDNYLMR